MTGAISIHWPRYTGAKGKPLGWPESLLISAFHLESAVRHAMHGTIEQGMIMN